MVMESLNAVIIGKHLMEKVSIAQLGEIAWFYGILVFVSLLLMDLFINNVYAPKLPSHQYLCMV